MMQYDIAEWRLPPFKHQVIGVQAILENHFFFLADEMGLGKTKQAIDAAQVLFWSGVIDKVIVVAPAAVRTVWFDPEIGELKKHLWQKSFGKVIEFHARNRGWWYGDETKANKGLQWIITNYEFIRSRDRQRQLLGQCGPRTMLILDESSAVKNHRAEQTKGCKILRKNCGRVLLMNGTPISNSPLDMYSQGEIMNPTILNCQSFFHFRSRYAVMGGFQQRQIIGWVQLEDMQRRFKPYIIRRLKSECLDLPPKLPPVMLTATLTAETWNVYKNMRDELIVWLGSETSTAAQAIVKVLRLAQITSGILGGVEESEIPDPEEDEPAPGFVERLQGTRPTSQTKVHGLDMPDTVRVVGSEKLDVYCDWLRDRLDEDPMFKLLTWSRFRPEVARIYHKLRMDPRFQHVKPGLIWGGQKKEERSAAERLLHPDAPDPNSAVVVVGTPATGSRGLNLVRAHTVVDISFDYNFGVYAQAQDRVHRMGQTRPVSYFEIIAHGPQGQKTIDHAILKARRSKENLATWTTDAWKAALLEE